MKDMELAMESPPSGKADWCRQLSHAVRDPAELVRRLHLPASLADQARAGHEQFAVRVPQSFLRRMTPGDANDPLLLQVLPRKHEQENPAGFGCDPLQEADAMVVPGLLKKYAGRALVITTNVCAVHCRYCFRRHFDYHEGPAGWTRWQAILDAIARDSSLEEILLSGGDPVSRPDAWLRRFFAGLKAIPHVRRVRLHTRLPIVLPARVTDDLIELLQSLRAQVIVVVHANHANELVDDCAQALRRLVQSCGPVLNQAVLLKDVNDSILAQEDLCRTLINLGVIPYYLHQLDRVAGASHFETPVNLGETIVRGLREKLPGYAVPRFVQEVPGETSKTVRA